jgi:UrcA family protein
MRLKATTLLYLTLGASAAAYAAPESILNVQESTTISVRNINFNQPGDVAGLYHRIAWAADRVCGRHNLTGFHFDSQAFTRCYNKAVSDAVTSIGRTELTSYQQQQARTQSLPTG